MFPKDWRDGADLSPWLKDFAEWMEVAAQIGTGPPSVAPEPRPLKAGVPPPPGRSTDADREIELGGTGGSLLVAT